MSFNLQKIVIFALTMAMAICHTAIAKDDPTFGVTSQFLNVCDAQPSSYDTLVDRVSKDYWSKVSEQDMFDEFFPSGRASINKDSLRVYEYLNSEANELFNEIGIVPTEKWYLAIARMTIADKKVTFCQIRSYDDNIDGLRSDFERSTTLKREVISAQPDFKKYIYLSDSKNSFYNVWERQLQDNSYAFVISKSIVEMP